MPLLFPKAPTGSRHAFLAALQHLVRLGRIPAGLHPRPHPQPIYVLSVNENGAVDLPSAKLVSWRYFATGASGETVAGDVSATAPFAVTSLRYGDPARQALDAWLAVQASPEVQNQRFEPRLLRIPGALVQGYWLKPSDDNGLIFRFGPTFGTTPDARKLLSIDGLLNTLRPVSPLVSAHKLSPQRVRIASV